MLNFKNLTDDIKKDDKVEEYLNNFFTKKNYLEYEVDGELNPDQSKAIKIMFESKKDLNKRIDDAFDYDPFCVEAFFAYMMLAEDVFLQLRFSAYFDEISNYPGFDDYQKKCYIIILNFYVEFLLDISNITGAIKIQRTIIQLTNKTDASDVTRLSYMYFVIEDYERFYKLYLENEFTLYDYLLLMVTLLKHDEDAKAREVLGDCFDNIKYATYIDHVWDLDKNDPEQKEVIGVVNECYEDLVSIPTFFSWVNKNREKYGK